MPVQMQTMALGAKFANRIEAAQKQNVGKEPETFGGRLPGGIRNGVAFVKLCRIEVRGNDSKAPGQEYWTAMGVVVEPKVHDGVPVEGLQTRQFVTLDDTKTSAGKAISFEENWSEMLNHLKLLVGREPVDAITGSGTEVLAKIRSLMSMIETAGIYTRFETDFGKEREDPKNKGKMLPPMVFERWLGRVDYTPTNGQPIPDNTGKPAATTQASPAALAAPASPPFDPAADELADLAALASRPDNSPESGQATKTLTARAVAAGISAETVENAPNWAAVVDMIKAAEARGPAADGPVEEGPVEDGPVEDEAPWQATSVSKVVNYDLYSASKKKKTKTQCEVAAVQVDAQTVHLKNLTTGKVLLGGNKQPYPVKWSEIELVS